MKLLVVLRIVKVAMNKGVWFVKETRIKHGLEILVEIVNVLMDILILTLNQILIVNVIEIKIYKINQKINYFINYYFLKIFYI
jgi:hypothetical protein